MALPGSGNQVSMKDILDEKQQGSTARTNVSLKGLSVDGIDDSSGGDITGTPNGSAPYGIAEFHSYSQKSFNGSGPGSSTFSFSGMVNASNHPNFDMDITDTSGLLVWEMQHRKTNPSNPNHDALSIASIRIGRDITNNRILILLLKDGDNSTQAGQGSNGMYLILPYVGLGSATWTFKFEYDTTDSEYNSTTGNPKVFFGGVGGPGALTTSTLYHSAPSNPGTYQTLNGGTGLANNGESILDISSNILTWSAKVSRFADDTEASIGRNQMFAASSSIPVRLVIKAVDGSDTYTATSAYWNLGLSTTRGQIV